MKKIRSALLPILLLALTMLLAVPAAAQDDLNYITDWAGILTQEEWSALEGQAQELVSTYDVSVYAVIVEDYSAFGSSMEECAQNILRDYALGSDTEGDVLLLVLSMEERDYWLLDEGEYFAYAITDYGHESLKDAFLDNFGNDDWYGGLSDFLSQSGVILQAAADGAPIDAAPLTTGVKLAISYIPAFLVGSIAALITCSIFKAQMKTAVAATSAEEYVSSGGVKIRVRKDQYTHTSETRRKIEKESSSDSDGNHSSGGKF